MSDTLAVFGAMADADFGKLVLFHADPLQRDYRTWGLVTSSPLIRRSHDVLRHMNSLNNLAQSRRSEEIETIRAKTAANGQKKGHEWKRIKSEYKLWKAKSDRFSHRVSMAMHAVEIILREQLSEAPEGHLRSLFDAVLEHQGTMIREDFEPTHHDERLWKLTHDIGLKFGWV